MLEPRSQARHFKVSGFSANTVVSTHFEFSPDCDSSVFIPSLWHSLATIGGPARCSEFSKPTCVSPGPESLALLYNNNPWSRWRFFHRRQELQSNRSRFKKSCSSSITHSTLEGRERELQAASLSCSALSKVLGIACVYPRVEKTSKANQSL